MEHRPILLNKNTMLLKTSGYQVRRMVIPVNGQVDKHFHSDCTDIILPLSGDAIIVIDNTKKSLLRNEIYTIKPPEVHALVNISEKDDFVYLLIQDGKYDFIGSVLGTV